MRTDTVRGQFSGPTIGDRPRRSIRRYGPLATLLGIVLAIGEAIMSGASAATMRPVATLVSPAGAISANAPTYQWNSVPDVTWYYLWVDDATGTRITQWYTAEQAGCAPGTGMCSVTPTTMLMSGPARWWIRTFSSGGYGPWSPPTAFTVTPPSAATLIAPSGWTAIATPTYRWNAVAGATWYQLWVDDITGNRIKRWFRAADTGCGSGAEICAVTPDVALAIGAVRWWVQTWSTAGSGAWSDGVVFTVSVPPAPAPVAPADVIMTFTPTYTWSAAPSATWYYLWVNDREATPKIAKWFRAADVGCATGEEAYSLAIVLADALGDDAFRERVKIYATDLDEGALAQARLGVYAEDKTVSASTSS